MRHGTHHLHLACAGRRLAALAAAAVLAIAGRSDAAGPPVPVTQFDVAGFLQAATIDTPGDLLSGGTLVVNGQQIAVPRNAIVVLPAANLSWGQLFDMSPLKPNQTGLAMADAPPPLVPYEVHVVGNRVASGGSDRQIAGLVFLSQQSANSGQGYVNFISYGNGASSTELRVGGIMGDPTTGERVRVNDPLGRFGPAGSPDPRFTIDEENPTIRTETAFPMCLPRADPAGPTPDALCPEYNRPKDPATGAYSTIFTMPAPKDVVAPGPGAAPTPDPMLMAPFEVGDFVTYAGTLFNDGQGDYISAHTIIANVGIHTAPGTDPTFVAVDVTILGTGGAQVSGINEATARTRFEGFTSDPFRLPASDPTCADPLFGATAGQPCAAVDLYGLDVNPCTAGTTDRPWGAIDVDPGPPTGVKPGRWRFRPPNTLALAGATGAFDPPTQQIHARARGATPTLTKNGILAGQYVAPITQYLFPENAETGTPIVANNFESFPFLVNGLGPLAGAGSPVVGQLSPWPGASAPAPAPGTCAVGSVPVASAGAAQNATAGSLVTLDGTGSNDPGGSALTYAWTAPAGVTLSDPTAVKPTFTAPFVPGGSTSSVLTFTLVVTNAQQTASAPATTTVTVTNPSVAPDQVVIRQAVYSKSKQRLDVQAITDGVGATLSLKNPSGGPDIPMPLVLGVPTASVVGIAQPASVTVVSSQGGTATSPVTRIK